LIERAYALGAQGKIDLKALPLPSAAPVASTHLPTLSTVEKELILRALEQFDGDKVKAATALGISRRTIYRRLKEYGLL
jgi:transcriptional regulator of acetoin/glycerol metabolism